MRRIRPRPFVRPRSPLLIGRPLFASGQPWVLGPTEHRFVELPDGFRIEHEQRPPVTVHLTRSCLLVTRDQQEARRIDLLCSGRQLTKEIAGIALGPVEPTGNPDPDRLMVEAWTLAPRIFEQRNRLLAKVDPAVLAVQELMATVGGSVVSAAQTEALYRDPYIARDILNYRAAAIALAYLESEFWEHFCAQQLGTGADPSPELFVQAMRNWRGLYSPTGVPYRSLNRTLMNLPKGIPPTLLCRLNRIRLERPILDRLELTALLAHAAHERPERDPEVVASQRWILQRATADQIRGAIARIATATERDLSPRRDRDVVFAIDYLADYPGPYQGTLEGLVRRAIRWHREVAAQLQIEKLVTGLGGLERPTAQPPIPLPTIPGITFLATVGAVVEEGRRMENCIASYAQAAVSGDCFLFHIDHEEEMASAQVNPHGEIFQAEGPRNSENYAASWGWRQLDEWASAFPHRRQFAKPPPSGQLIGEARRRPAGALRRGRRRTADPNQLAFPFYAQPGP